MRNILFILILLSTGAGQAQELIFMSGGKLLRYCSNGDNASMDRGLCEGYLAGMMDAATTVRYLSTGYLDTCVTPDTTPFMMRNAFLDWAAKHPEDLDSAASSVVLSAFVQAFPCKRDTQ